MLFLIFFRINLLLSDANFAFLSKHVIKLDVFIVREEGSFYLNVMTSIYSTTSAL